MEVLLTTDHYPDSNTSVNVWNPYTGTKLLGVKGPPAAANSLVLLRDEGFLVAEEGKGKPFIHVWQVGHPLQSSKRIICPVGQQKLGPMAMSPGGNFLVVAIHEKINVWQPATGRIIEVVNSAHYRPVTVLKFTDDGSFLISGGADGIVSVWNFLVLTSGSNNSPIFSWANHSLTVNAIHVGSGGRKATIFTVSEDRFLKIYSLLTGSMLLSVAFPQPLSSIAVDAAEMGIFVGGNDGGIYYMNMSSPPRSLEYQIAHDDDANVLKKHVSRITCLAISSNGKYLASGDKSGCLYIWNLDSKQAIRTILGAPGSATKGPVTNLSFWLNDPELLKGGSGKKPTIVFPDVPKLVESNEDERQENEQLISVWNRIDQMDCDDNMNQGRGSNSTGGNVSSNSAEINQLKSKLDKSEGVNRQLYSYCIDNILHEPLPKRMKHKK